MDLLDNDCQWNLRSLEHDYLWTLYNGRLPTLRHSGNVTSLAFSPDGKQIVSVNNPVGGRRAESVGRPQWPGGPNLQGTQRTYHLRGHQPRWQTPRQRQLGSHSEGVG